MLAYTSYQQGANVTGLHKFILFQPFVSLSQNKGENKKSFWLVSLTIAFARFEISLNKSVNNEKEMY